MTKTIALIDYGSGNLRSAANAFEHVIKHENLDYHLNITNNPEEVLASSTIILPGQGAFQDCMKNLESVTGMIDALEESVLKNKTPFLGICVGMQLLADHGLEHGTYKGLGWIAGDVVPIVPKDETFKIPHMGWNEITCDHPDHILLRSIEKSCDSEKHFYFVHSFMFQCKERQGQLAHTNYGEPVTAIIGKENIIGVQFHPEKSQAAGLKFIRDFLNWTP